MSINRGTTLSLRFVALVYLALLLLLPVGVVFWRTFEHGFATAWSYMTTPAAVSAFWLTVLLAVIAVPLNTIFGVGAAMVLARSKARGRSVLDALIDLPFVVSPVIVGLALILVYGQGGWFGDVFQNNGIRIIYAVPGMVIATVFVSLPFVVREVTPVLREVGDEQEEAAATLGASSWQTFWRVTLPTIRWGVAYGVVLTTARALGEIGAVLVVSSNVAGSTLTLPLLLFQRDSQIGSQVDHQRLRAGDGARRDVDRGAAADDDVRIQNGERAMRIDVDSISKRFGDFTALDDVSLEVPEGSLTALLGPSGSGKSTLLRIIAGLEEPDQGVVRIAGKDVTDRAPPGPRDRLRVPALRGVRAHERVRERRVRSEDPQAAKPADVRARVDELLALVGLTQWAEQRPHQLSGGQRQRMALARALAVEPQVLLLDEPFGALDANVRAELRRWLRRLHDEQGVTTVLVTHDQEEAMEVADTIAVMNKGAIEQVGAPREVYDKPASPFVMGFLGPVSNIDGHLVRPHDVSLSLTSEPGLIEAMVKRVVHLGFEVRIELELTGGEPARAQLTRGQSEELELAPGDIVFVRPPMRSVVSGDPAEAELAAAGDDSDAQPLSA